MQKYFSLIAVYEYNILPQTPPKRSQHTALQFFRKTALNSTIFGNKNTNLSEILVGLMNEWDPIKVSTTHVRQLSTVNMIYWSKSNQIQMSDSHTVQLAVRAEQLVGIYFRSYEGLQLQWGVSLG